MTDLASWDAFEREHPSTFSGMYQFWVQKAALTPRRLPNCDRFDQRACNAPLITLAGRVP